ncbi:uncharacterized protein NEMAJ01_0049 [Nematocida major]|uniref:uncharacterized protein n=1 Tax=Nematocida major TaxID=1912982 RepID=UPI002008B245|nr:uncharacterized protein NEMAJ01_0049 [Nematocida major]KAH9385153.1 hypothetical protein NEMAJ01_0049 [Nematocida major]
MRARTPETNEITKRILTGKDPMYNHLLLSSVNVLVFKYEEKWINTETEGVIHIYKRRDVPSTAILILNRKSPSDFYMLMDKHVHSIETYEKFIIISKAYGREMEIFGLWFYDSYSCIEAGFILADQLSLLKKSGELMHQLKDV